MQNTSAFKHSHEEAAGPHWLRLCDTTNRIARRIRAKASMGWTSGCRLYIADRLANGETHHGVPLSAPQPEQAACQRHPVIVVSCAGARLTEFYERAHFST
jgi:hypothetical protein